MKHLFVSADSAQFVSFAAKVVVGCLVPQMSSLFSFFSTPKALILYFFGNFGNLLALSNDMRWWPSVRQHRTRKSTITLQTWLTVCLALSIAAAILVTDLLLFQLADRKEGYRFRPTSTNFTFDDVYYRLGSTRFIFPSVLNSNSSSSAQKVFGNNIYLSNDGGEYKNYTTEHRHAFLIDGPEGQIEMEGNYTGTPRCTVSHYTNSWEVEVALSPVGIRCFLDEYYINSSDISIVEETANTLGISGKTIVSFFQTIEGANYLFVELVQRVSDFLESKAGTTGDDLLRKKIDGYASEGYTMESCVVDNLYVDMDNNTLTPLELLELSLSLESNSSSGSAAFLYSKTVLTYKYGKYPMYTKQYILWGTFLGKNFFKTVGSQGNFFSFSYNTRQYLIKDRELRSDIYGLNTSEFTNAPLSPQYSTDLTDDEVVLATIQDPNFPILVTEQEFIDIFPGLLVISICSLFIIVVSLFHQTYRRTGYKRLSFDVHLEIVHKGLESVNGLNAWYLPAKLEATDNMVMVKGLSLVSNTFTIGLAPKGTSSSVRHLSTSDISKDQYPSEK